MTPRTRQTTATARRIDNMRTLIAELGVREMLADEIAWLLKFSPSGARKYIRDLREAGVIELARYIESTATYLGKAVYRLAPDQALVAAFLATLDPKVPAPAPPRIKPALPAVPGRSLHIMADDTHYAVRVSREPARRDVMVVALFGPAPADGGQS